MDNILNPLLNFGIGGCMAAAVLYYLYIVTNKTIPDILARHREDMIRLEDRYDKRDSSFQRALESVCDRMEGLDDNVASLRQELASGGCPSINVNYKRTPHPSTTHAPITSVTVIPRKDQ